MEQTLRLIRQAQQGDKEARNRIVEDNTGLIWCVVKRFGNRGVEMEDLFQIGSIGLMKAIAHFDASFKVQFSTYAVPMISGEIKRYLRDNGILKVSRSLKEIAVKASRAQARWQEKNGREPTVQELAETIGASREDLIMAMEASSYVESLYQPVYEKEGRQVLLMDKLKTSGKEERVLDQMLLKQVLGQLKPEERQLIYLRYFADATQRQVGEKMGISQVQVSRMEKKILKRMRGQFE